MSAETSAAEGSTMTPGTSTTQTPTATARGGRPPALYLRTRVTVLHDRDHVPAHQHPLARRGSFHVITAWNPGGRRPAPAENRAANHQLRADLRSRGLQPVPALGAAPGGGRAEESWAVAGLTDEDARAIGAAHRQSAVFRIDAHHQTVLACTEPWQASRPHASGGA